jgi:hypothetical protein
VKAQQWPELKPIDITHIPDLPRLAEEVARSGIPRVLRSHDRDVAVISPAPSKPSRAGRGKRTSRKDALWDIVGIADAADFPDVPDDVSTQPWPGPWLQIGAASMAVDERPAVKRGL